MTLIEWVALNTIFLVRTARANGMSIPTLVLSPKIYDEYMSNFACLKHGEHDCFWVDFEKVKFIRGDE